jgi:DNA-binding beta-propeller fold protein YncE
VGNNLYVTDTYNHTVRKVAISSDEVTTFAGSVNFSSTDGPAAAATFLFPTGIAADGVNLYVTDDGNRTIRKMVIATGVVSTIAGTAGVTGHVDGTGSAARFGGPYGIATDGINLYVTDATDTVRKIVIASGEVSTLAGVAGTCGRADGVGTAATFCAPAGIATDGANLYVADSGSSTIRKIVLATTVVTTLAGTSGSSPVDGIGTAAQFHTPMGIATDGTNLFVADMLNHAIRKIVIASGAVTTLAGTGPTPGSTDGPAASASFWYPKGITIDSTKTYLYVADSYNNTVRKIVIATGEVTTVAGSARTPGFSDGAGTAAGFNDPEGITAFGGNLYVADTNNHAIREIH